MIRNVMPMIMTDGQVSNYYIIKDTTLSDKDDKRLRKLGVYAGSVVKIVKKIGKNAVIIECDGVKIALGKIVTDNMQAEIVANDKVGEGV